MAAYSFRLGTAFVRMSCLLRHYLCSSHDYIVTVRCLPTLSSALQPQCPAGNYCLYVYRLSFQHYVSKQQVEENKTSVCHVFPLRFV